MLEVIVTDIAPLPTFTLAFDILFDNFALLEVFVIWSQH